MPRTPVAGARAVRRARVFQWTKGFQGKRKNCYSIAVRAAEKAMQKAYIGRKEKKRTMRSLWISRIGAAAREYGFNYSQTMNNLVVANVQLNRKVLSELAIHEPKSFAGVLEFAKSKSAEAKSKQGLASIL